MKTQVLAEESLRLTSISLKFVKHNKGDASKSSSIIKGGYTVKSGCGFGPIVSDWIAWISNHHRSHTLNISSLGF